MNLWAVFGCSGDDTKLARGASIRFGAILITMLLTMGQRGGGNKKERIVSTETPNVPFSSSTGAPFCHRSGPDNDLHLRASVLRNLGIVRHVTQQQQQQQAGRQAGEQLVINRRSNGSALQTAEERGRLNFAAPPPLVVVLSRIHSCAEIRQESAPWPRPEVAN